MRAHPLPVARTQRRITRARVAASPACAEALAHAGSQPEHGGWGRAGTVKLHVLGDSVTAGCCCKAEDHRGYAQLMEVDLRAQGYEVHRMGGTGRTAIRSSLECTREQVTRKAPPHSIPARVTRSCYSHGKPHGATRQYKIS